MDLAGTLDLSIFFLRRGEKAKVILDYKILNGEASTPQDFNVLIMVEYPNWAAFDSLRDKTDPHHRKGDGIRRSNAAPLR